VILTELLPKRSVEDVLAERVRVVLGGQEYVLPTLSIADAEGWRTEFARSLGVSLQGLSASSQPAVLLTYLGTQTDMVWRLISAFDKAGVLPSWEDVKPGTTEIGLARAFLEVVAAVYPLVVTVLEMAANQPEVVQRILLTAMDSAKPATTSSLPPSTDGPPARSDRNSATSSSSSTSMPRPIGAGSGSKRPSRSIGPVQ
jgi:hypothetical protein